MLINVLFWQGSDNFNALLGRVFGEYAFPSPQREETCNLQTLSTTHLKGKGSPAPAGDCFCYDSVPAAGQLPLRVLPAASPPSAVDPPRQAPCLPFNPSSRFKFADQVDPPADATTASREEPPPPSHDGSSVSASSSPQDSPKIFCSQHRQAQHEESDMARSRWNPGG